MRDPQFQHGLEMTFVERNQEIQALSPKASPKTFAFPIRLRCPDGRSQNAHAHGGYLLVQFPREGPIAVVNHESIGMILKACAAHCPEPDAQPSASTLLRSPANNNPVQ